MLKINLFPLNENNVDFDRIISDFSLKFVISLKPMKSCKNKQVKSNS